MRLGGAYGVYFAVLAGAAAGLLVSVLHLYRAAEVTFRPAAVDTGVGVSLDGNLSSGTLVRQGTELASVHVVARTAERFEFEVIDTRVPYQGLSAGNRFALVETGADVWRCQGQCPAGLEFVVSDLEERR